MIPNDLEEHVKDFPDSNNINIVVLSGNNLRGRYFSMKICEVFGDNVTCFQYANVGEMRRKKANDNYSLLQRMLKFISKIRIKYHSSIIQYIKAYIRMIIELLEFYKRRKIELKSKRCFLKAEIGILWPEVMQLEKTVNFNPLLIENPNSPDFITHIRSISPYFFLTLGGPLYCKELLNNVRGAAINQHSGWSPDIKGAAGSLIALYHRRLDLVGNTIHIIDSGADSGAILRRSNPTLISQDSPESIHLRAIILGTELMIETVQEIIENRKILTYSQPKGSGATYLSDEVYLNNIRYWVEHDFKKGWYQKEVKKRVRF